MRRLHLWLGLALGALVLVSGLTGSALVYYVEIDDMLVPELSAVPADARPTSWQGVYDALQRDHPERTGAWRIEVREQGGAIPIRYYDPVETRGEVFAPLMLWLDPRDYSTIRSAFWGEYPTTWIYKLHWQLLAGPTGATVMGLAGAAMLLLLASGLVAWWPRRGYLRNSIRWKSKAASVRRLYDIHKLTAIASVIVLFVVVPTGVMLEFPQYTRPLLERSAPLFAEPTLRLDPNGRTARPLDALVARAQARFPDGSLAWIQTPGDATAPVRLTFSRPGEPSRRFPRTTVWIDPYSGAVLATRDGMEETRGDIVLNWLHPLHAGEVLGPIGRLIVFLSGLASAALALTGFSRWLVRYRRSKTLE
ncbi:PepSY domain-containing protein [Erythrobacter litoralis]|uniref:PepSY-associated TM helix domain-containing protein n=1 Tax=Erythrobacter litoralis TaxID=39960 RepID=UPI002434ADDB|nr:PepSY-associated TM helix domain-containing protein [Erythrobacter litoralis]MDG6080184.1 PepSY domain-containing protein [Erythrobacter litoralis]